MLTKQTIWKLIRYEKRFHKLQYAKTPRYDALAAVFGVVCGAFVVYFTLTMVGWSSIDLTDMTAAAWYVIVFWVGLKLIWLRQSASRSGLANGVSLVVVFFKNLIYGFFFKKAKKPGHIKKAFQLLRKKK